LVLPPNKRVTVRPSAPKQRNASYLAGTSRLTYSAEVLFASDITFSRGFLDISQRDYGIDPKEARETVIAPDRRARFDGLPTEGHLFLRHFGSLDNAYALLVLLCIETRGPEINFAWKAYPSLLDDFFRAEPHSVYEALMRRYGVSIEALEGVPGVPPLKLLLSLNPDYLKWLRSHGRGGFEETAARIVIYAATHVAPAAARHVHFLDQFVTVLHDFAYYCRQHSEAIAALGENQIRDLFLVLLKCIFQHATGEAFRFDGKVDFEVISPANKYETISGEFKWWAGRKSAAAVFHQATRKHATGQELAIAVIILNRGISAQHVFDKTVQYLKEEPEVVAGTYRDAAPAGSVESMGALNVNLRSRVIPMYVVVINLYHERF
jgi:hypothetical protein